MRKLESNDFKEITKSGVWIVDFYADWCGPCKMLSPVLEQVNYENTLKVNVDEYQELSNQFGVMSIPTIIFLKDGKEVEKLIGFQTSDEIVSMLKKVSK